VSLKIRGGFAHTRLVFTLAAALPAGLMAFAAGPLPSAWEHWHYSRVIETTRTDTGQLVNVTVPLDVFVNDKSAPNDLRVIDDQGRETPYVLFRQEQTKHAAPLPTTLRENSFTPGQFTQLVIDAGPRTPFHNSVRIDTAEGDFIEWVEVDASDDGHVWRVVQEGAPIFRFRKENHAGVQVVNYSENNAQFVRVRILDRDQKFLVIGAHLLHETVEPPDRIPAGINLTLEPDQKRNRTAWRADLGGAGVLVTEVHFDVTSPPEFIRSVRVSSSSDGKNWGMFHNSDIFRYRRGDAQDEELSVAFPNAAPGERFIQVEILNGNDAPLTTAAPVLYVTPRHVIFEQQPNRGYSLIYGQERGQAPNYDLGRRVSAKQLSAAIPAQPGPEEVNPGWVDPRPWTETHDIFLWLALLVAVMLLGYAAVRSLRQSAAIPEA
jgi:Protein of unknown function (DUF3999)